VAAAAGGTAIHFMQRAISLARAEQPHPNPRVGAVIVSPDGAVVGEGAHEGAGEPHAEVVALRRAGAQARGATAYVTLEPCSHQGRTPPCTDALIAAGVARVVVGAGDPDPRVSGSGLDLLARTGVEVTSGVLADEVEAMDPGYFHHRRTGRPLVTLKLATTLDGQTAAADGTSRWITSEEARRDGHRLRSESDVVIVGAGTVIADDPRLDVRLDGYRGRHPRPVVVSGRRPLPPRAVVLSRDPIVYTPAPLGLEVEQVTIAGAGRVDLGELIGDLGRRGYVTALVEGGATLAADLVRRGLVDRFVLYLAGKLALGVGLPAFPGVFATISQAVPITIESVCSIGPDIRVEAKAGE
jgi:diaminohydroxyphosphoribosylaminopyrimidine deaminase/5-amino-6-(5-phosphoribosylamino)uracil reductase